MLRRTLLLLTLQAFVAAVVRSELLCKSIEIRTPRDFELIRKCSVVVGHVHIANVDMVPSTMAVYSDVEEITDYLLVYRAQGLQSLALLFPRLTLIRGRELYFDQYSLVVYENPHLASLGLASLLRVQQGDIHIEGNPMLCFANTIHWMYLMGNGSEQQFSVQHNKSPDLCPECDTNVATDMDYDDMVTLSKHCWDLEVYQRTPIFGNGSNCPAACGTTGCDTSGLCCSRNCLSGCYSKNCQLCSGYRLGKKCVEACNVPNFQNNKRDCVMGNECRRLGLIPHAGYCVEKCPNKYLENVDANGQRKCALVCAGSYVLHTAKDLDSLKDCVTIRGSLTIELTEIKTKIIADLERELANVKEITGFLKITRSTPLMSLNFLRNLDTIRGDELIDHKYALYVVDNQHLEQIWQPNQNVAILRGHVYFHLNPRLCYEKIQDLRDSLKSGQKISIIDASPNSNGERVVCGSSVRVINATVEDFNSTAVRIKVDPVPSDYIEALIGYLYHYKEAPVKNVTMYDGRHGCGHDNWLMNISISKNMRHIISNLRPYTQYAYFVRTLTKTSYHIQMDGYSKIQYFRTLPSKPGPVAKIFYHKRLTTELQVFWWPPRNPNGIINKYILSYEMVDTQTQNLTTKNYASSARSKISTDTCHCGALDPDFSGAAPADEDYYSREQLSYEEALLNLIYVSRTFDSSRNDRNDSDEVINSDESTEVSTSSSVDAHQRMRRKTPDNESNSLNAINKSEKDDRKDNAAQGDSMLLDIRRSFDLQALAKQDTGVENYPIIKPLPICSYSNASVQYQLENSCKPFEQFNGNVVPGNIYTYTLANLEPNVTYRISVRACVEGLENGCGPESIILAETAIQRLESFMKG